MKVFIFFGGLICFLAVAAGALGAHALKGLFERTGGAANFDLATSYMFYHGLGLLAVGLEIRNSQPVTSSSVIHSV